MSAPRSAAQRGSLMIKWHVAARLRTETGTRGHLTQLLRPRRSANGRTVFLNAIDEVIQVAESISNYFLSESVVIEGGGISTTGDFFGNLLMPNSITSFSFASIAMSKSIVTLKATL